MSTAATSNNGLACCSSLRLGPSKWNIFPELDTYGIAFACFAVAQLRRARRAPRAGAVTRAVLAER